MTEWQPIATAPKEEGVWVLGCVAGSKIPVPIGYDETLESWFPINGCFRGEWIPTHWMPLPEPPRVEHRAKVAS